MLKLIVTPHRWVGVPLGILFLVTLVTGLLVGSIDLFDRAKIDGFEGSVNYGAIAGSGR